MPRGGVRPGAGQPPAGYRPPEGRADFELERARHEKIKADQRELKLAIERNQYVSRDAVRQASATLLAIMTQALRSLPDGLERKYSLAPEVVESIGADIDGMLSEIAATLKAVSGDG